MRINQKSGQVSVGQSIKEFFKGYADFRGRTTRAGFWWPVLIESLMMLAFSLVAGFLREEGALIVTNFTAALPLVLVSVMFVAVTLALFLPNLALLVRRLRDAGFSGNAILLYLLFTFIVMRGLFVLIPFLEDFYGAKEITAFQFILFMVQFALIIALIIFLTVETDVLSIGTENFWRQNRTQHAKTDEKKSLGRHVGKHVEGNTSFSEKKDLNETYTWTK